MEHKDRELYYVGKFQIKKTTPGEETDGSHASKYCEYVWLSDLTTNASQNFYQKRNLDGSLFWLFYQTKRLRALTFVWYCGKENFKKREKSQS